MPAFEITLRNRTAVPQNIFVDGNVYTIPPFEVRPFPTAIAEVFLQQRSTQVDRYTEVKVPPPQYGDRIIWIANCTGDPFAPPTMKVKRIEKGKVENVEMINGISRPSIIHRKMGLSQIVQPTEANPGSRESLNLGFTEIELPPYTRAPVASYVAEWMIRRDAQQEIHNIGKVKRCRAPTDYEPNEAWDIPRLLFYANVLAIEPKYVQFARETPKNEADELAIKAELLKVYFFRLIDPRYNLPTREQFEAIYTEPSKPVRQAQTAH